MDCYRTDSIDKIRLVSDHTGATELEGSMSEVSFNTSASLNASLNLSMDFDRHSSLERSSRFRVDESEGWEDSFAIDDGQPLTDPRTVRQSGLETVVEPDTGLEEDSTGQKCSLVEDFAVTKTPVYAESKVPK